MLTALRKLCTLGAMTINEKIASAFNNQVTAELEASMVYLQLSYVLDDLGLTGMRDWMKAQSKEELEHAQKFAQHLLDRDYTPQIGDIAPPKLDVTSAIQDAEKDYDSRALIDWFLNEQIEEEATVGEIIDRLRIAGDSGSGILRIDGELGSR